MIFGGVVGVVVSFWRFEVVDIDFNALTERQQQKREIKDFFKVKSDYPPCIQKIDLKNGNKHAVFVNAM